MNKIYRLVWNASQRAWVVAGEYATAKGKGKNSPRRLASTTAGILGALALSMTAVEDARAWVVNPTNVQNGGTASIDGGATGNVAIGNSAVADSTDGTTNSGILAIGYLAKATSVNSMALGWKALASSAGSVAFGPVAQVLGTGNSSLNSIAFGNHALVNDNSPRALALGAGAQTTGDGATSIGPNAISNGAGSFAMGPRAEATGTNSMTIGGDSSASGTNALTVGVLASSSGTNSVAQGYKANATGNNTVALGSNSSATASKAMAIGDSAKATLSGGLALGSESNADTASGISGYAPANASAASKTAVTNTTSTRAAVSVGDNAAGIRRQITDVAAGTANTDAINVAQLKALEATPLTFAGNTGTVAKTLGSTMTIKGGKTTAGTYSDANLNTDIVGGILNVQMADNPVFVSTKIGSNTTIDGTGLSIASGPTFTKTKVDVAGNKITNVAAGTAATDAVNLSQLTTATTNPLTFAGNTGTVARKLGDTMTIKGGKTTAGTYSGANLNTVADASGTLNVQMAENPVFVSTIIGSNTTINGTGLSIASGPTFTKTKVDVAGNKITNVAAGTVASDAVNLSQLTTATTNPLTFAGNTGSVARKLGDTMTVKGGKTTAGTYSGANLNTVADASGTLNVQMAENPVFVSTIIGSNTTINGTGLSIASGPTFTKTKVDVAGNKITNVAAGTAATDAVNLSQLTTSTTNPLTFAGNTGSVAKTLGSTMTVKGGKTTAGTYSDANLNTVVDAAGNLNVQMAENPVFTSAIIGGNTTLNSTGMTIAGGPSVTTTGINAASKKITNVAAGIISATSTDAINGSQLNTVATNPLTFAGNTGSVAKTLGSTMTVKGGKTTAGTYSDANLNTVVDAAGNLNVQMADNPVFTSAIIGGNTTLNSTGMTIAGGPSVTTTGINAASKKITNVAAGIISATSTDAINGSQLNTVATNPLTFAGNTGSVAKTLGSTMTVKGGKTTAGTYSDANLNTVVDAAGNLNVQMADNPVFTSAIIGGNTTLNSTGMTLTGGPSVTTAGINAASMKIVDVAAGVADTDAVNVSQLREQQIHYFSVNDDGRARANYDNTGATGLNSLAAGIGAHGAGEGSLALGMGSLAAGMSSIAHGVGSLASGESSVAIGTDAKAHNTGDVALGAGSETATTVGTVGTTINETDYTFAGVTPSSTVSVGSVGNERTITNVAAGRLSASSTDAINGSQLFATNSAIDDVADDVSGLNDRTLKYDWTDTNGDGKVDPSEVDYGNATLAGATSTDGGRTNGTKITNLAQGDISATSTDAINGSQLNETNNNVTNLGNTVDNIYNTGTKYFHANSTGTDSSATGRDAIAIGMGAVANIDRSVAIGDRAATQVARGTSSTVLRGEEYTFAGTAPVGTVSVGDLNAERTITNVAAGRLSSTSTDAVNGSQLFASNQAINDISLDIDDLSDHAVKYDNYPGGSVNYNKVTLGGDTYNSTTHTGGTTITNVADGVAPSDAVNFSQLTETNNNVTNLGDTVDNIYNTGTKYFHANSTGADSSATGMDAIAIGMGAISDVARSIALGDGAQTAAAVGTAGTRIAGTDYAFAGATPVGSLSIGKAGEERTITNVAAGRLSATSTDAVNGSQLFATNTAIDNLDINVEDLSTHAVKYDNHTDGTVNYNSVTMGGDTYNSTTHTGGTTITNVADGVAPSDAVNFSQLTETNNNVTNLGDTVDNIYNTGTKYFHANSTGADSSATGMDAIAIGMGAISDVARSIALGDGAQTAAAVGTAGTRIAGTDYAFAGATPVGSLSIGKAGEERTITNVAAGRLSATSTDAVNGSQLFATNTAIDNLDINVEDLSTHAVKYDNHTDGTVNYNSVTMGGDTYNSTTHTGGTTITNVADGVAPSDAVNFSQLTETNNNVTNLGNTVTNLGDTVDNIYNRGTKYFHANSTGADSVASGMDAVAIGMGAIASANGSVALGAGSVADGSTLGNTAYLVGGTATGEVNIGGRRITGLSAGAEDTDAVNVAQLKAVGTSATEANERALKYDFNDNNGNGIYDAGDTVNYGSAHLGGAVSTDGGRTGGTKIANLARGDVSANSSDAINGSQLFDVAGDTTNEYITNNGRGVRYVRTNDTDLPLADAHASGQASTAVGYNATSSGIGSIAMGQNALSSATNAVAIGKDAVASTTGSVALGNGAKTADVVATSSMTIRGNNYAVAGNTPTGTVSVGDVGQERTITNVAAGRVTASSTDAVNGSQLYATVTAINNISTDIKDLGEAAVKYDKNGDGTINYNHVTLAGKGEPTTISNLAAGTQDSDAVNYSQLKTVANQVTNISNGTDGMFQVNNTSNNPKPSVTGKDAAAGGAGAVASGDNSLAVGTKSKATASNSVALGTNSVADRDNTVSVGSVGGERQIANVAAGTKGTDAVNVSQLNAGINNAYNYTDNKFDSLKNMVDDNKHKMSAGIAGAMAMSSLPQPYSPGASMVSLGGGTFQDETAVALGASMISDNGKWVTKVAGTTNSQGDMGASVGVGYQW